MVVRRRNCLWMIIVHSCHKRANHKIMRFEVLMNRRRLMNSPRNRFKVFDIEFVRVKITVPTNNIKRMRGVNEIRYLVFFFDFNQKIAFLIFWFYKSWRNNIALTKRRMFQQLSKFISVTFRRVNRRMRFYEKENSVFRL